jgi:hypothetical protein
MVPWSVAALLLLLPLVAMLFTDEMAWDGADFAIMGAMLFGACGAYELGARTSGNIAYRVALGILIVTALFLAWISLAAGIIGSEDHPANLMYGGVLAVAVLGALLVRLRPEGMARASALTALAQISAGATALAAGWGSTGADGPGKLAVLTGIFALLWLLSAWLFRQAARVQAAGAA